MLIFMMTKLKMIMMVTFKKMPMKINKRLRL